MPIGTPDRGRQTATPTNVAYRIGRIAPYVAGRWLDFGCADGGYAQGLLDAGAAEVVGVDVEAPRVAIANARELPGATFLAFDGERLPFPDASFDGAFVNEVLEHVTDERRSLAEIVRVLKPGGVVAVMSPNRWFPVEGHAVNIAGRRFGPAPLVPWLPLRLTDRWTEARNYWPTQLTRFVEQAGFDIVEVGFVWPVFEQYPWLPRRVRTAYQKRMERIDDLPGIRRLGVSTLVVGRRP